MGILTEEETAEARAAEAERDKQRAEEDKGSETADVPPAAEAGGLSVRDLNGLLLEHLTSTVPRKPPAVRGEVCSSVRRDLLPLVRDVKFCGVYRPGSF